LSKEYTIYHVIRIRETTHTHAVVPQSHSDFDRYRQFLYKKSRRTRQIPNLHLLHLFNETL